MKKRILSFLLVLVLLFNAVAVFAFASESTSARAAGDVIEESYEPLTLEEIKETVGADNLLSAIGFDKVTNFDYASGWAEGRKYYESNGTEITDAGKIAQIERVLTKLGNRPSHGSTYTAFAGTNATSINNALIHTLKTENGNSYFTVGDPISYEDYMALAGVYWLDGNNQKYVLNRKDAGYAKYKNETYFEPLIDTYANATARGRVNQSFALSFDVKAADFKPAAEKEETFLTLFFYNVNNADAKSGSDLLKLVISTDGNYKLRYKHMWYDEKGNEQGKYIDLIPSLSKSEYTRITLLFDPVANTYDIMINGVTAVTDAGFLYESEKSKVYKVDGEMQYVPTRARMFRATTINDGSATDGLKFDHLIGEDYLYGDNVAAYYTDKFIEHKHNYVVDVDCCYKCTICHDAYDCVDTGTEGVYLDGDFGDKITFADTYYDTAEDKTNKNGYSALRIGSERTYETKDFRLSLNNRMGVYHMSEGGSLVMGTAASAEYYAINVGDDKQHNQAYLTFTNVNAPIRGYTAWASEEVRAKYAGRSMILSGKFKGAETFNFDNPNGDDKNNVEIGLLNAGSYYTYKSSIVTFYLATLTITRGDLREDGKYDAIYSVTTSIKDSGSNGDFREICKISADKFTDIATFINLENNTVEYYVNGERVLSEYNFNFVDYNSSAWKVLSENSDGVTIKDTSDLIIMATKCASLAAGIFAEEAKDENGNTIYVKNSKGEQTTTPQYTYKEVTGDFLYIDSIDMVYAEEYNNNYKTNIKDGYCDKCGKAMLDVEGRNVALGASIALNYYVDVADTVVNDATVTLTNGKNRVSVPAADGVITVRGARKYTFNMTAIDMAKPVEIRVSIGDNTSMVYTTSVADYAVDLINSTDTGITTEAKALAKAMLNYGAAAQVYLANYKERPELLENLANAGLTDADKVVPDVPADFTAEAPEYTYLIPDSASLILEGQLKLRIYYSSDLSDYTVTAKITKDGETTDAVLGKIGMMKTEDNEEYFVITIEEIMPADYDALITVTLDSAGGNDAELKLSVNTVIGLILSNNELDDNFKNLAKALYDYHVKAVAYGGVQ